MNIPKQDLNPNEKFTILLGLFFKDKKKKLSKIEWGRECAAAKRLMNKYPDFHFFYSLVELQDKFNSLLGLLNKQNNLLLKEKYDIFIEHKQNSKTYDMIDNLTKEFDIKEKPTNLMDFLK